MSNEGKVRRQGSVRELGDLRVDYDPDEGIVNHVNLEDLQWIAYPWGRRGVEERERRSQGLLSIYTSMYLCILGIHTQHLSIYLVPNEGRIELTSDYRIDPNASIELNAGH